MKYLRIAEIVMGFCLLLASGFLAFSGLRIDIPIAGIFRWAGLLILGQGLIRDVCILSINRSDKKPGRRLPCLCVESSLGVLLLSLSVLLSYFGDREPVSLSYGGASFSIACLWFFGYLTRDYVIQIHKDPDHINLVVL